MITFKCEKCGHIYKVSDEYGGKRVRCKECQTINMVNAVPQDMVVRSCEDSIAAYNNLLNELLRYEKQAPSL